MSVFVDTSALYALLDESDANHHAATEWFADPAGGGADLLVTHSFVLVETAALVHRRLGTEAVRVLYDALVPALRVVDVDEALRDAGTRRYLASLSRSTSLVDAVSFEHMADQALSSAFTFDANFAAAGFEVLPT